MHPHEFRELVERIGDHRARTHLGISPATLRRWKAGQCRIPPAAVQSLRLYFEGDLAALSPAWDGFKFSQDLFYIPGFRQGLTPGALRAMFFRVQQVAALEREVKELRAQQWAAQQVRQLSGHSVATVSRPHS